MAQDLPPRMTRELPPWPRRMRNATALLARPAAISTMRFICYRSRSGMRALDLAEKLGLAFQLTNIIRDAREDRELGRVYLPEEDLARYGVSPEDLGRREVSLGVRELLRFEADRAWSCYEEGAALLSKVDADSRAALWLLIRTYSALLARMEALDFAVLDELVRVPTTDKLYFAGMARFGRLTEENVLEKRDRDRRRAGGVVRQRARC